MAELPLLNDTIECSCRDCASACYHKPGWFLPEEIKPAADLLGMTEEAFFKRYLSVDYFGLPNEFLYVLSPATENSQPGEMFPLEPSGMCVFLKNGKCGIHAAKPFECKLYDHRKKIKSKEESDKSTEGHLAVAEAWIPFKARIAELLGREPDVETNHLEVLGFMLNMLKRATE